MAVNVSLWSVQYRVVLASLLLFIFFEPALGGAEGVGRSTTQAVVASSLTILLVDFFLTRLLF